MLHRVLTAIGCAALVLLLAGPAAEAADDAFTVSNVHEDVTAASALAARDKALAQGQSQAFTQLMARLAPGSQAPHLTPDQLTDLVASFEVAHERTSTVRYVADYTFHFRPAAVKRLLQDAGTSIVTPARPLVVLPVYRAGGATVLWDDPNPWRDAWANHAGGGSVQVLVPVGDLTDVSMIDAPKALSGDAAAIHAMSERHQNDDVVVVLAQLKDNPTRLEITATRYAAGGGAPQSFTQVMSQHDGETMSALFDRSVGYITLRLAQSWQAANTVDTSHTGAITVRVPVQSLTDWVAVRNRLGGVGLVRSVELVSMGAAEVEVTIHYVGDAGQLRRALAAAGLDLEGSDPDWVLRAAAPGASPAAKPMPTAAAPGPVPGEVMTPDNLPPPGNGGDQRAGQQ